MLKNIFLHKKVGKCNATSFIMSNEKEGFLERFEKDDIRRPAHEMDEMRQKTLAYEYLCHLEEAKLWLEVILGEVLPTTTELEENLRNGVFLAKLGNFIAPNVLPRNKIYDPDQKRYKSAGLQFRHTDNIHQWLKVLKTLELPITFQPETTDVYDKKNMPRVIYCIHALSTHLFKLGRAPLIQDLYGKVNFTDDEIDVMKKQLQQYGIVMPSFKKIGGLLSSNLKEDVAALHAAIININKTIDVSGDIGASLLNPDANLKFFCPNLIGDYAETLRKAKEEKIKIAQNRSLNESYIPDVYDELLMQAEIQGYMNCVNFQYAWFKLAKCIETNDNAAFCEILNSVWLDLKNFNENNVNFYIDIILHLNDNFRITNGQKVVDWPTIFQSVLNEGNSRAEQDRLHKKAVEAVNKALDCEDLQQLYEALNNPNLEIDVAVDEFALPLLYEEMKLDRTECEKDLNHNELSSCLHVLSAVAAVSKCIDYGDGESVWIALNAKAVHVQNIHPRCKERYIAALSAARKAKCLDPSVCSLLTYPDIQDCIDIVNTQDDNNEQLIEALSEINQAVLDKNGKQLIYCLRKIKLNQDVAISDENVDLYMRLLRMCVKSKGESQLLWLQDVENVISQVDMEVIEVKSLCETLADLNLALLKMDGEGLMKALVNGNFGISKNDFNKKEMYHQTFQDFFMRKNRKYVCPWVVCHTNSGSTLYIDIESCMHAWNTPKDFLPHSRYLSRKDIVSILKKINRQWAESEQKLVIDRTLTRLQAHIRGFLLRQKIQERYSLFEKNVDAIVKIQSWWKSHLVQKKYRHLIRTNIAKTMLNRLRTTDPWSWFKLNESKIVKIQAFWRGKCTRRAFLSLIKTPNPSFKVVQKFIPILEFCTDDYNKELELQTLKSDVVQAIRKNQELAKQIEAMDVKIGLLVQNRITLQDVVAHGLKLNSMMSVKSAEPNKYDETTLLSANKGLKALTKESKKLLDSYQHLFYALQTNPIYLSRLLHCLSQNKMSQMLQNVILTLYNFGANTRDEYLLIKFFRTSLEEDIKLRICSPFEIVTDPPIVLKMAVNHSRAGHGPMYLKKIIGPLVTKILNENSLVLETNPIDIFKAWRNQLEMQSGKISSLPFNVTTEQALSYPEVRSKLDTNLGLLKRIVTIFLDKITASRELLPFCITYMCRVLNKSLSSKFPQTPEKDILKVIGHLVYYLFLNSVIVAPDLFDIIKLDHDQALPTNQRKNLATVAKLLHFSASKKGFGDESAHLKCLNQFIIDHHESMKDYFRKCCQGPSLEDHYCVNEYTEATLVNKPHIFISVQEILGTHSLLLEHEDVIASDPQDKIHELLDDIGNVPSASELTGKGPCAVDNHSRTDVCLTLVDKFNMASNDMTNINKLFIKTKELSVSVMPFLQGEHFLEALCIGTTTDQQEKYIAWINQRVYSGAIRNGEMTTLREHITILRKYIALLEDEGFVTREDGYQSIITGIALDLCNKGKYRQGQRRALQTLKKTKQSLDEKTKFYQDQCLYYDHYIKKCLENLTAGKKNIHKNESKMRFSKRLKSKLTLKYSALKLYEKGVILEIEGLSVSQFKNVQFEITPQDHIGAFSVKGKFMGVEVEQNEINIQDLLQMQYEGCAIMDMFGKAKVNVNLLLFLLNSKFYGKT